MRGSNGGEVEVFALTVSPVCCVAQSSGLSRAPLGALTSYSALSAVPGAEVSMRAARQFVPLAQGMPSYLARMEPFLPVGLELE